VRWRGVAVLHGLVVDWHFSPRTQAFSEPESSLRAAEPQDQKTNIWTALPTRLNVTAPPTIGLSESQHVGIARVLR
jgi:hypothetical protein